MPGDIFSPYKDEKITINDVKEVGKNVEEFRKKNIDKDKKTLFDLVKEQATSVKIEVVNGVNKDQIEVQNKLKNIEIQNILKEKFSVKVEIWLKTVVKALKTIATASGPLYKDLAKLCDNCSDDYDKAFFDAVMEYQLLGVTYWGKANFKGYGVDGIAGPITMDSIIADLKAITPKKVEQGEAVIEKGKNKEKAEKLITDFYNLSPKIIEANKDLIDEISTTENPTDEQIKGWEKRIQELSASQETATQKDEGKEVISEAIPLETRIKESMELLDREHVWQKRHYGEWQELLTVLQGYKDQLNDKKIGKEAFDLLVKTLDEQRASQYVEKAEAYKALNDFRKYAQKEIAGFVETPKRRSLPDWYVGKGIDEAPYITDTPEVEKNADWTYSVLYTLKSDLENKYIAKSKDPQLIIDKDGKVLVDLRYFYVKNHVGLNETKEIMKKNGMSLATAVDADEHIFHKNGGKIDQRQAFLEISHNEVLKENPKRHDRLQPIAGFEKNKLSQLPAGLYLFNAHEQGKDKLALYDGAKYYYGGEITTRINEALESENK